MFVGSLQYKHMRLGQQTLFWWKSLWNYHNAGFYKLFNDTWRSSSTLDKLPESQMLVVLSKYIGPPNGVHHEEWVVYKTWRHNPISFEQVSFWCLFFDPHLTTPELNTGVQLKKSNQIIIPAYLSYQDFICFLYTHGTFIYFLIHAFIYNHTHTSKLSNPILSPPKATPPSSSLILRILTAYLTPPMTYL